MDYDEETMVGDDNPGGFLTPGNPSGESINERKPLKSDPFPFSPSRASMLTNGLPPCLGTRARRHIYAQYNSVPVTVAAGGSSGGGGGGGASSNSSGGGAGSAAATRAEGDGGARRAGPAGACR
ncbi:Protein of unknown function, partial [Gryllus bimaculatus]